MGLRPWMARQALKRARAPRSCAGTTHIQSTLACRSMPSVLFLHANAEDYLADSLLHGLRSLLGADVVDVPRRDSLYEVEDQSRVYGRGFTLYGTLPEIDVWRGWAIDRALPGSSTSSCSPTSGRWAVGVAALAAVSSSTGSFVARRRPLR